MRISDWSSDVCSSDLLQADDEQQHHHAEFGEMQNRLDIGDQLQAPGPDNDAGNQVAEYRAKPQPLGNRHGDDRRRKIRSEEHTSELQSLMRISYAVFCLKKKKQTNEIIITKHQTIIKITTDK